MEGCWRPKAYSNVSFERISQMRGRVLIDVRKIREIDDGSLLVEKGKSILSLPCQLIQASQTRR
jgi:hypothetical protein